MSPTLPTTLPEQYNKLPQTILVQEAQGPKKVIMKDISLERFKALMLKSLGSFEAAYKKGAEEGPKKDPPEEWPTEQWPGDWFEQFAAHWEMEATDEFGPVKGDETNG